MLFALHVPYSWFCKGLIIVKWPKHVKINIRHCCVWLVPEIILFSFSDRILYCKCHNNLVYINFKRCASRSNTAFPLWYGQLNSKNLLSDHRRKLFLVRLFVVVDQKRDDLTAKRFVFKEIRWKRKSRNHSQEHLMNWKNKFEPLLPFFLLTSQGKASSLCLTGCIIVWKTLGAHFEIREWISVCEL
jgi:hypothetical protein